jgi:hypothetical protein
MGRIGVTETADELDGGRLIVPGQPEVWLVYFGVRHYITSPATLDALFSDPGGFVTIGSIDHIERGADLNAGTCLVRADGDPEIFLVTGYPDSEVRRHPIVSFETFVHFGFDESKIREVPALVLAAIPSGRELQMPT